ncbi:hypothetical protein KCU77_g1428, partial [Aureobasidium melanogenum]
MFVHDLISILESLAYRNKENLKRHLLLFSRRDLRKRHIKKQHPQCELDPECNPEADVMSSTTEATIAVPGSRIHVEEQETMDAIEDASSNYRTPPLSADDDARLEAHGDPSSVFNMLLSNRTDLSPADDLQRIGTVEGIEPTQEHFPITLIQRGVQLYFRHVSPFLPFIHQHTFEHSDMPEALLMGMLSIGLQFGSEQEMDPSIPAQAFKRGRKLLTQAELSDKVLFARNIHTVQAYLLLELYATMCSGGRDTTIGLQMHHKSVELVRRYGLTEPLTVQSGTAEDLDALWRQFVRSESHKRTLFAVYQLDVYCRSGHAGLQPSGRIKH